MMNLVDRIRSDSILHAMPTRELAKGQWLKGGYETPSVPGRVAVLVRGTEARMLGRTGVRVTKEYLNGCVAYVRTGAVPVPVSFTEEDAVRTRESYPCVGKVTLEVIVPELAYGTRGAIGVQVDGTGKESDASDREHRLKAFVLAHVRGGGEQIYGPEEVASAARPALMTRLRRELKEVSLEQVGTASDRIGKALRADPGEDFLSVLRSHGLHLGEAWSLDLHPGAYSDGDQKAFEEVRAEAEALLKERRDPASAVIYQVMGLHNIAPSFRVNIWFSRMRDRPSTRGAIGVYADHTHKDSGVYHHNEEVSLEVLCSRDAYLYLLDLDSEGEVSLLFPNELHRDNRIAGGQTFRLPDAIPELFGGSQQRWAILSDTPRGTERLKAIATLKPITILPEILGRNNLLYCRSAADALPDVVEMVEKVRRLARSEWADCASQFHIE